MDDFSPYLWHDDVVRGLRLELARGNPDWRSELVLDLMHIVAWPACGADGNPQPQFAPASLRFHDAGDLKLDIDCGDSGGQVALCDLAIDRVERLAIVERKVHFDRPCYRWRIDLNVPRGGSIAFAATVYTMTLADASAEAAAEAAAAP